MKDGGRTHLAALWDGTGMQFSAAEYNRSAGRFRDIVERAGTYVMLSTHPQRDKVSRPERWRARGAPAGRPQ